MAKASDHIVLVTGAGAGIGAATARRYASEGARVIAADYQVCRLDETRKGFENSMRGLALDLRNSDAVFAAVAELPEDFKDISILVTMRASVRVWSRRTRRNWAIGKRSSIRTSRVCSIARARSCPAWWSGNVGTSSIFTPRRRPITISAAMCTAAVRLSCGSLRLTIVAICSARRSRSPVSSRE